MKKQDAGKRIDVYLRGLTLVSRKEVQRQIQNIFVNNKPVKKDYVLIEGDRINGRIKIINAEQTITPAQLDLQVIYEDKDLICVNKPSGLLTCPMSKNPKKPSVLAGLKFDYGELARSGNPLAEGVIHRLDKDTSGAVLFARTNRALERMKNQFSSRKVEKYYIAVVHGKIFEDGRRKILPLRAGSGQTGEGMKTITINKPLKLYRRKWKLKPSSEGKESITKVSLIKSKGSRSIVECMPVTGRTHQIRVHLASSGHPVIGDTLYHKECGICKSTRLMLHAYKLVFKHPTTQKRVTIVAPTPEEFRI